MGQKLEEAAWGIGKEKATDLLGVGAPSVAEQSSQLYMSIDQMYLKQLSITTKHWRIY